MSKFDIKIPFVDFYHKEICQRLGKEPLGYESLRVEVVSEDEYVQRLSQVSELLGVNLEKSRNDSFCDTDAVTIVNNDRELFYIILLSTPGTDEDTLAITCLHELSRIYLGHFDDSSFEWPNYRDTFFETGYIYYREFTANFITTDTIYGIVGRRPLVHLCKDVQSLVDAITISARNAEPPVYFDAPKYAWLNSQIMVADGLDEHFVFPEPNIDGILPAKLLFKQLLNRSLPMTKPDYKPTLDDLMMFGEIIISSFYRLKGLV